MRLFYTMLVFFVLMVHVIHGREAFELNREEIIDKITRALKDEGKPIGPVMVYRIVEYDMNSNTATIPFLQGETFEAAELELKKMPIIFLKSTDEKVLISYEKRGRLNELYVVGYFDEQYACIICFGVRENKFESIVIP